MVLIAGTAQASESASSNGSIDGRAGAAANTVNQVTAAGSGGHSTLRCDDSASVPGVQLDDPMVQRCATSTHEAP